MKFKEKKISFKTFDGIRLKGTLSLISKKEKEIVIFLHGGGVNREELGLFTKISELLREKNVSSLRFDFIGHGESDGTLKEVTLLTLVNSVTASIKFLDVHLKSFNVHLVGSSLGGAVSILFSLKYPNKVISLTLLNPLIDIKKRFLMRSGIWKDDHLNKKSITDLKNIGWLDHYGILKLSREFINEAYYYNELCEINKIEKPILILHGTKDTKLKFQTSLKYGSSKSNRKIMLIKGAEHEFINPGDKLMRSYKTKHMQYIVCENVVNWILMNKRKA